MTAPPPPRPVVRADAPQWATPCPRCGDRLVPHPLHPLRRCPSCGNEVAEVAVHGD